MKGDTTAVYWVHQKEFYWDKTTVSTLVALKAEWKVGNLVDMTDYFEDGSKALKKEILKAVQTADLKVSYKDASTDAQLVVMWDAKLVD